MTARSWSLRSPGMVALACCVACGGGGGGGGSGGGSQSAAEPSASTSTVTPNADEGLAANGSETVELTVVARDADGSPLADVVVTIAASGAGNTLVQADEATGTDGMAVATLASTVAGAKSLTITLERDGSSVELDDHPIVRFGPRAHLLAARYFDEDADGVCGSGDTVTLTFDQAVGISSGTGVDSIDLPVDEDAFGTGATLSQGSREEEIVIGLGTSPKLRTRQEYDALRTRAQSPSGVRIDAGIATRAIHDLAIGQTVAVDAPVDLVPGFVESSVEGLTAVAIGAVAAADLNGDGRLDLVVEESGSSTQSIWLEDGHGDYVLHTTLSTDSEVRVFGDLDGDGDLDLVLTPSGNNVIVAFNDGDGQFTSDPRAFGDLTAVALGDMDGDGDLDLVGGSSLGELLYSANPGDGQFAVPASTAGAGSATAIALGDVDADGDLDAVLGSTSGDDEVFLNDGAGNFTWTLDSFHTAVSSQLVLWDDDGDGDADLYTSAVGEGVRRFESQGDGTFLDSGTERGAETNRPFAVADFDTDGDRDVLVGTTSGWELFEADGTEFSATSMQYGSTAVDELLVQDFDADGDLDVTACATGGSLRRATGSVTGTYRGVVFDKDPGAISANVSTVDMESVDVDGDGDLDLVHASPPFGGIHVYLRSGDTFVLHDAFGDPSATCIVLGDIDGDGDPDLIEGLLGGGFSSANVYTNDGDGTFTSDNQPLGTNDADDLDMADFDGDGDLDVLIVSAGAIDLYTNDGSGTFSSFANASLSALSVKFGDLDGDGDPDFVLGLSNGARSYVNNGGTFSIASNVATSSPVSGIDLFDFDHDGDLDVFASQSDDAALVFENDGAGVLSSTALSFGDDTHVATGFAFGDIDGDGRADVLMSTSTGVLAWHGDGPDDYAVAVQLSSTACVDVITGDFDGDGDLDLVPGIDADLPLFVHRHD